MQKISKYKDLEIQIEKMRHLKITDISMITIVLVKIKQVLTKTLMKSLAEPVEKKIQNTIPKYSGEYSQCKENNQCNLLSIT